MSFALTGLRFLVVVELARSTKYHVDSQRTTHTLVGGVVMRQHHRLRRCQRKQFERFQLANFWFLQFATCFGCSFATSDGGDRKILLIVIFTAHVRASVLLFVCLYSVVSQGTDEPQK
jgi:hypothetical protein